MISFSFRLKKFNKEAGKESFETPAFYINNSMNAMKGTIELVMDSTTGTNSSGAELFGVLAELDNAYISLGYMFIHKDDSHTNNASST
ncbi:hypothetical protein OnM2_017022b [Erysiphe neolycopersici]|uniref:Uncharacterized protein n=1 Tax=Erysiphe neolycopersici TaxID=212602 RepID=A0A420I4J9_9PEZI|nr:hypothetical protein OnM2_017022b [Erysiphe neolycopersici]